MICAEKYSRYTADACTENENGDTHREAEAKTVQKTLVQRIQLRLSHHAEVQSNSEKEDGGRFESSEGERQAKQQRKKLDFEELWEKNRMGQYNIKAMA